MHPISELRSAFSSLQPASGACRLRWRCYSFGVMGAERQERKTLKMVACQACGAKVFIPGDLAPLSTTPCTKCEHPLMMPMQLRQFELRDAIASGGMGTVYRAWDGVLDREVAVKLMKSELADDPKSFESFLREARAAAALNHTNIIHIYTFDEWGSLRYLVMELADRGSLDSRIESEVRLSELQVTIVERYKREWARQNAIEQQIEQEVMEELALEI